jgi:hypothetical protein
MDKIKVEINPEAHFVPIYLKPYTRMITYEQNISMPRYRGVMMIKRA